MSSQVAFVITTFLYLLIVAIVLRALMSWFPVDPRNQFARFLYQVTEPLLEPVRRLMPRTGIIDLSAMLVVIVLLVMVQVVNAAAG